MSHRSYGEDQARKNGVARCRHVGATGRIREALGAGPLTVPAIAQKTGDPVEIVQQYLGQLCNSTGGVVRLHVQGPPQYALFTDPAARNSRSALLRRSRPIPECPECGSTWLVPDFDNFRCRKCDAYFLKSMAVREPRKTMSGSGLIAGRRTIPAYKT